MLQITVLYLTSISWFSQKITNEGCLDFVIVICLYFAMRFFIANQPSRVSVENASSLVVSTIGLEYDIHRGGPWVRWFGGGAPLAVIGLSNLGKAWLFLDFKKFISKNRRGLYSSLILKHLKKNNKNTNVFKKRLTYEYI